MQKTGNPITFRDANTFYNKAVKAQRTQSDWMSRPTQFGKESGRGASRRHMRAVNAQANLQNFSMKLLDKVAPQAFADLETKPFAFTKQFKIEVASSIAMRVIPGTDLDQGLINAVNFMSDYKNSDEIKFSLKGQTFSSVWKHFDMRSHALFNHQGSVAANIYLAIKEKVAERAAALR